MLIGLDAPEPKIWLALNWIISLQEPPKATLPQFIELFQTMLLSTVTQQNFTHASNSNFAHSGFYLLDVSRMLSCIFNLILDVHMLDHVY